ncbi:hypothetical protein D3C81_1343150 [compost metagenome]
MIHNFIQVDHTPSLVGHDVLHEPAGNHRLDQQQAKQKSTTYCSDLLPAGPGYWTPGYPLFRYMTSFYDAMPKTMKNIGPPRLGKQLSATDCRGGFDYQPTCCVDTEHFIDSGSSGIAQKYLLLQIVDCFALRICLIQEVKTATNLLYGRALRQLSSLNL